jgi:hypothetical protein
VLIAPFAFMSTLAGFGRGGSRRRVGDLLSCVQRGWCCDSRMTSVRVDAEVAVAIVHVGGPHGRGRVDAKGLGLQMWSNHEKF